MHKPNLSPLGEVGTVGPDLRDFDRVLCPSCGFEFACPELKMFGIFPRRLKPFCWAVCPQRVSCLSMPFCETVPNQRFEPTAASVPLAVPSSLRSSAAAQARR
jgi:hypothetical protein